MAKPEELYHTSSEMLHSLPGKLDVRQYGRQEWALVGVSLAGATLGGVVGGPLGLYVGAKVGVLAGAGVSSVAFQLLSPPKDKGKVEMQVLSSKPSPAKLS